MLKRLLLWNVRGLNDTNKRVVVKNFLREWKGDVVCVQESKVDMIDDGFIRSLWGIRRVGWKALPAAGAAGGIIVMWNTDVVELVDSNMGTFSVSCAFKSLVDGWEWLFSGIYGPGEGRNREDFWAEMRSIRNRWDLPWVLGGDFNLVLHPEERSRGTVENGAMREFQDFLYMYDLMDLPLAGGSFTWSSMRENPSFSRIDRFLVSLEWEEKFSGLCQKLLPRTTSDHHPILLDLGGIVWGPTPFRFENMWLKVEGFKEMIRRWWNEERVDGFASYVVASKLKRLKAKLKIWNKEVFGDYKLNIAHLSNEIGALDMKEVEGRMDNGDRERRNFLRNELMKVINLEEISWRQKSRSLWLKEGDRNTRFFHRVANSHRRNNCLSSIEIDGRIYEDVQELKEHIPVFYRSLYTESSHSRPLLEGMHFDRIDEDSVLWLERPFEEEEIVGALKECDGDKAPGPDGFTMAFFISCWDVVREDVMQIFHEFHETGGLCGKSEFHFYLFNT